MLGVPSCKNKYMDTYRAGLAAALLLAGALLAAGACGRRLVVGELVQLVLGVPVPLLGDGAVLLSVGLLLVEDDDGLFLLAGPGGLVVDVDDDGLLLVVGALLEDGDDGGLVGDSIIFPPMSLRSLLSLARPLAIS